MFSGYSEKPYIGGSTGSTEWRELREQLLAMAGYQCLHCRRKFELGSRRLLVHHADGDPHNQDPDNLEVLCVYCHARAHYGWRALISQVYIAMTGREPPHGSSTIPEDKLELMNDQKRAWWEIMRRQAPHG